MKIPQAIVIAVVLTMPGLLTSCAVTTAPTESSTETLEKTTDASSKLSSSTSPDSSGGSAAVKEDFTRVNMANLKKEAAAGRGEHLAALGALMGVPEHRSVQFCNLAQTHYTEIFPPGTAAPHEVISRLEARLIDTPVIMR
jgi:hypothetical protein